MTAQAMLLTLDLRWTTSASTLRETYHLQEGSIIQVIGYKQGDGADWDSDVGAQFGDEDGHAYGLTTDTTTSAQPFDSGHVPTDKDVWLADNTQTGHEILYTGTIQNLGSWYGLYTQITVDDWVYDRVYIRVFGATDLVQDGIVASYWGVSPVHTNTPSYQTDTFAYTNLVAENPNYFEVIPEPATLGLLGVGGVALAAWRRRRFARTSGDVPEREEE